MPVVATAARSGKGLAELRHQAAEVCRRESWEDGWKLTYVPPVEAALGLLETGMSRRRAVALLWGSPPTEGEQSLWQRAQQRPGSALRAGPAGQPDGVGGGAGGGDRAAVRPVRRARPPRPGPGGWIGC